MSLPQNVRTILDRGVVIPASPLALDDQRQFSERYQRAVWRYYSAAGAGGIAVGVHTTQFAIRDPKIGLFQPLLALAKGVMDELDETRSEPLIRVAGICGQTEEAVAEASFAADQGFHTGLLNLSAMRDADDAQLAAHCQAVAQVLPVFGFYLQASVGGRPLPYSFWRRFAEVDNVVAIKIAAFNRYQTIDVVRALAEAGRDDITLYTGNDDNIVADLVTPFRFMADGKQVERRFVGGLLGHWACWTRPSVELLNTCHKVLADGGAVSQDRAGNQRGRDRYERRPLRRGQPVRRLHPRRPRNPPSPGTPARHLVPRSRRSPQPPPERRTRPRLPGLSTPDGRRIRRRESCRMAFVAWLSEPGTRTTFGNPST